MEQQKPTFQKAFAHLYYLMLSADRIADPSELALGNKIIKYEGFEKTEVMEQIDRLSSVSRNQVIEDCISLLRSISRDDQLKCLAYVKMIAMSDGSFDESESNLLHNIGTNELNVMPPEINKLEKQLQQKINPEG